MESPAHEVRTRARGAHPQVVLGISSYRRGEKQVIRRSHAAAAASTLRTLVGRCRTKQCIAGCNRTPAALTRAGCARGADAAKLQLTVSEGLAAAVCRSACREECLRLLERLLAGIGLGRQRRKLLVILGRLLSI